MSGSKKKKDGKVIIEIELVDGETNSLALDWAAHYLDGGGEMAWLDHIQDSNAGYLRNAMTKRIRVIQKTRDERLTLMSWEKV